MVNAIWQSSPTGTRLPQRSRQWPPGNTCLWQCVRFPASGVYSISELCEMGPVDKDQERGGVGVEMERSTVTDEGSHLRSC